MAQDIFLIDKKYLVANTPVDESINPNETKSAFKDADLFDLVFLGIPLLDLFRNHVRNSTTLTSIQTQLFEMVQYYNAYRVYYHLSFNIFKVANAGVTQPQDTVSMADLKEIRNQIDTKTTILKKRILEFIAANKSALPQATPEPETTLDNDPLDTLGVVWSPNIKRYFY
jgi:hypothetical protein